MKLSMIAVFAGVVAVGSALPAAVPHVVHEKRIAGLNKWTKRDEVQLDPKTTLPVRVGLKQQNLDLGYDFLMDVSHPSSPN